MSARLNMKELPLISWKGRSFNQITSSIKKNGIVNKTNLNGKRNFFHALPLKIYRREIASTFDMSHCNSRVSIKINEFDMPNGTIINSNSSKQNGLVNTLDFNITSNTTERPGLCKDNCILSQADNAKRRLRSSGMIKRKYNESKNNDTYYTSTTQYLVSRNRTFQQNQYNYIRVGNSSATPGDSLSVANLYSPQGITHCKKYTFSAVVTFQYQWVDALDYTVTIPIGSYSVDDINGIFQQTMNSNGHYLIYNFTRTKVFLLNIAYNNLSNVIELQSKAANTTIFSPVDYTVPIYDPAGQSNNGYIQLPANLQWNLNSVTKVPGFKISSNSFTNAIGFTAGNYPTTRIVDVNTSNYSQNQTNSSSFTPGLKPVYTRVQYKPNNPQFAQQGAVTSSSLTARVRYNSITDSTVAYRNAFGKAVGNALAYGVPEGGYTIKDKIGYPLTKTPIFSKYNNIVRACVPRKNYSA
jgi:hypothetical protein